MRLRVSVVAFVAVLLLPLALAGSGGAATRQSFFYFVTPSRNIGCMYESTGVLRCDIRSGLVNPSVTRPKSCGQSYGDSLILRTTGRPHLFCHGDTVFDPSAHVFNYATSWRHGGFICRSATTGLTCTNLSGHGFFLSRQHWYTL